MNVLSFFSQFFFFCNSFVSIPLVYLKLSILGFCVNLLTSIHIHCIQFAVQVTNPNSIIAIPKGKTGSCEPASTSGTRSYSLLPLVRGPRPSHCDALLVKAPVEVLSAGPSGSPKQCKAGLAAQVPALKRKPYLWRGPSSCTAGVIPSNEITESGTSSFRVAT